MTKSPHPAGKKKKKEKENETLVIQNMTHIGLENNEAIYWGDTSSEDHDPVVREVVEETRATVEEMMNELNGMVDQTTQTPPPPQFTVSKVYDNAEEWTEAKDPTSPAPPPPPKDDKDGHYLSKSWLSKPGTSSPTMFRGLHGVPLPRGAFGGAPMSKGMELCQMSHSTLLAVLWARPSLRLYEGRVSSTSSRSV